jgi:hypothetical protein
VKRELDNTTRPVPINGETLDRYLDRYLRWWEDETLAIIKDTLRRAERKQAAHTRRTNDPGPSRAVQDAVRKAASAS